MNYGLQKTCYFCRKKIDAVDYKNAQLLSKYMSGWSRIKPARITGNCTRHQKELTRSIKRARFLAIIPYVSR